MTQRSKCLVIDTDIAGSAGGENAQDTRSKQCRDVLKTVRDTGHAAVVTEMISEEWRRTASIKIYKNMVNLYVCQKKSM